MNNNVKNRGQKGDSCLQTGHILNFKNVKKAMLFNISGMLKVLKRVFEVIGGVLTF